jgi:ankyrin repeat protein
MNEAWKRATGSGDLVAIRALLDVPENLDSRDEHGQTALMNAARSGRAEVVTCLIEQGADLDVAAKYGLTALMLAIVNGHTGIAMALVRAGADVTRRGSGAPGFAGKTAVDLARARNQSELVSVLESGGLSGPNT